MDESKLEYKPREFETKADFVCTYHKEMGVRETIGSRKAAPQIQKENLELKVDAIRFIFLNGQSLDFKTLVSKLRNRDASSFWTLSREKVYSHVLGKVTSYSPREASIIDTCQIAKSTLVYLLDKTKAITYLEILSGAIAIW